jgi:hypothetical protein
MVFFKSKTDYIPSSNHIYKIKGAEKKLFWKIDKFGPDWKKEKPDLSIK